MTRKPVKTSEKSRRKFMAKDACPAVLLPTVTHMLMAPTTHEKVMRTKQ